ncbi:hypothetical protein D3C78_1446330 [compost metagenome]
MEPNILNKIGAPIHNGAVKNVQNRIMMYITTDRVFNTLYIMQERFGTAKTYSINSYLTDLKQGVFSELKTNKPIEPFRRGVQTSYVNAIIRAMKEAEIGNNVMAYLFSPGAAEISPLTTNSDIGALLAMHLDGLRKEFTVSATTITDKDSKEHLLYLADYIKKAMSRRFEKNPTK